MVKKGKPEWRRKTNIVVQWTMYHSEIIELLQVYTYWVEHYTWDTEYEQMLGDHLKDMFFRLAVIENKMDQRATLIFNNSEARAFYDFWGTTDTSGWPLANVLLCDMLKKIDKAIKIPKRI